MINYETEGSGTVEPLETESCSSRAHNDVNSSVNALILCVRGEMMFHESLFRAPVDRLCGSVSIVRVAENRSNRTKAAVLNNNRSNLLRIQSLRNWSEK